MLRLLRLRDLTIALAALLLLTPAAAPVYAQSATASVGGVVTDDTGGALPGVTITVANKANGVTQTLVTGPDGRFRAEAVLARSTVAVGGRALVVLLELKLAVPRLRGGGAAGRDQEGQGSQRGQAKGGAHGSRPFSRRALEVRFRSVLEGRNVWKLLDNKILRFPKAEVPPGIRVFENELSPRARLLAADHHIPTQLASLERHLGKRRPPSVPGGLGASLTPVSQCPP